MKQCEYCAKEISYHEMYCSEECEKNVKTYYKLNRKYQRAFSIINGIFVMAIGISIFAYSLAPEIGVYGASLSLLILGIMYYFLPFPPDVMIRKYKLKKSIIITRFISLGLLALGLIAIILHIFHVI